MKIAYCLPQIYNPGGIERITSIKANYFTEVMKWDVFIITAQQKGLNPFYPLSSSVSLIDLNIDYEKMNALSAIKRFIHKKRMQRIHKRKLSELLVSLNVDIVVSTLGNDSEFLPDIKDGSKKILEFHFCKGHKRIMADTYHFSFLPKLAFYYRCWQEEHRIIPRFDQFVVLTEEDKEKWKSIIPSVINIPNILPYENEGRAQLNNKTVISVGRLDAQKRFDRLIDIWAILAQKFPDWQLNIYGAGDDYDILQEQINTLNLQKKVILCGTDKLMKENYLSSSIFVMTSAYEGLPMTLLEASGLGLPSVCYHFPCGPKDVIVNGVNGFLVETGNVSQFVEKMELLMSDEKKRKEMGLKAYELSTRYSKEKVLKEWLNLFAKIK